VWEAGYDIVENLEGVLAKFEATIGLDRLYAIHLNDSLNPCGARKDRHAKIGEGEIGMQALSAITKHPRLRHLPFYLETPNELPGYADEISRLRKEWE
jgi:deoxyribonuclease-4